MDNTKKEPSNLKTYIYDALDRTNIVKEYISANTGKVTVFNGNKKETTLDSFKNDDNLATIIKDAAMAAIKVDIKVDEIKELLLSKNKTTNSIKSYESPATNQEGEVESKIIKLEEEIKKLTEVLNGNIAFLNKQKKENNIITTINQLNEDDEGKEYITPFAKEDTLKTINNEDFKQEHDVSATEKEIQKQKEILSTLEESLKKEKETLQQKKDEHQYILTKIEEYINYSFGDKKEMNKVGFDFINEYKEDKQIEEILKSLKIEDYKVTVSSDLEVTLEQYKVLPKDSGELEKWVTAAIKGYNKLAQKEDEENLAKYKALMEKFNIKNGELIQGNGLKKALQVLHENVESGITNITKKNPVWIQARVEAIKTKTVSTKDLFSAITTDKGPLDSKHLMGVTGTGQIIQEFNLEKSGILNKLKKFKENKNEYYKGRIEFENKKDLQTNVINNTNKQKVVNSDININIPQQKVVNSATVDSNQQQSSQQTIPNNINDNNKNNINDKNTNNVYTKTLYTQKKSLITDNNQRKTAVGDGIDLSQQLSELSEAQEQGFTIMDSIINGKGYKGSIKPGNIKGVLEGAQIKVVMHGSNKEVLEIYENLYTSLSKALNSNTKENEENTNTDYDKIGTEISNNLSKVQLKEKGDEVCGISEAKKLLLMEDGKTKLYDIQELLKIVNQQDVNLNNTSLLVNGNLSLNDSNNNKSFVDNLNKSREKNLNINNHTF